MTIEQAHTPEVKAPRPQIPRLGAAASGLVALLLVGAIFVIPFLGLLIAPLGSLPVLHFQSGGSPGYRAWGPVVALLVVATFGGLAVFALPLLAVFSMLVILPSATIDLWIRWRWTEGRWLAVTILVATVVSLAAIAAASAPLLPVEAIAEWARAESKGVAEFYAAMGMERGNLELALDAMEQLLPKVIPGLPIAYLVLVLFWMRPRLPMLGLPVSIVPFEAYRNDDWLPALFVLTGAGTLILDGISRWVAINLLLAVLILYFAQGLAMIRAHLARWFGRGLMLRWSVAFVFLIVPLLLCANGITDREAGLTGSAMLMLVAALGVTDSFHPLRPQFDDDGGTK